MKKIFLTFFSVLSLLFTSPALVLAAGSTLSLSPATGTFNKNCNFSLSIMLDTGGYETSGTDVILHYDPASFTANKINNGSVYPEYPGNNISAQSGTILVSGIASATSSFKGSGILATIDFTVLENAPNAATQITFGFDPSDKSNTSDTNVVEVDTMVETLGQVVNGNYVVGTGSCGRNGGLPSTRSATVTQAPWRPTPTERIQCVGPDCGAVENTIILLAVGAVLITFGSVSLLKR